MTSRAHDALNPREMVFALVGAGAALLATYWDDAWHTDRGRDTFWSAPHLLLYGGVVVALGVAVGWSLRIGRTRGWLVALGPGGSCRLAVFGGSAVLVSGPIDELWHRAYGRDAVLWSPPHLLAIAGSAALIIGLLLGLAPRTAPATIGGALALGAYLIPVMEFESDVPQFPPALCLPVLAIGVVLALPVGSPPRGRPVAPHDRRRGVHRGPNLVRRRAGRPRPQHGDHPAPPGRRRGR